MKKIIIIILTIVIAGLGGLGYLVKIDMEEGLYKKISELNKEKKGELGSLKIITNRKDISCSGFVIYTCTINSPKFGIKGTKQNLLESKNIILSNLNIFSGDKTSVDIAVNEIDSIDKTLVNLEDTFPLDIEMTLANDLKNKTINIYFNLSNKSLEFKFKTFLKDLEKDTKIINYEIKIKNKNIKTFIYNIYTGFLEKQTSQVKGFINKILFGEETNEIKTKESVMNEFSKMIVSSTNSKNPNKLKIEIDTFLDNKSKTLIINADNKSGLTLNEMVISKSLPIDNFDFKVEVK